MTITKLQTGDKMTVQVKGRLDSMTSPQLQTGLLPVIEENRYVELDFNGLVYISSAGLRVLLQAEKSSRARGGRMTLINVSPAVMEVFDATGFTGMLTIE